jgi:hypothetical protein
MVSLAPISTAPELASLEHRHDRGPNGCLASDVTDSVRESKCVGCASFRGTESPWQLLGAVRLVESVAKCGTFSLVHGRRYEPTDREVTQADAGHPRAPLSHGQPKLER